MKYLMLRAKLDKHELFNRKNRQKHDFNEVDDMWTLLSYKLVKQGPFNYGEVWYSGGNAQQKYFPWFRERWLPSFAEVKQEFNPDVIFARGGFKEYDQVFSKFPKATTIYYGAGRRYCPAKKFYHHIFCDTPYQYTVIKQKFPGSQVHYLMKPCADTIFKPLTLEKRWDICFLGNAPQARFKGHDWLFTKLKNSGISCLNVGLTDSTITKKYPHITYIGWKPRKELVNWINKCRVGVVCSTGVDSAPRVISEFLACGLPIVVLNETNFWKKKYIKKETGIVSNKESFIPNIKHVLKNYYQFNPDIYYGKYLSLDVAARHILECLNLLIFP